MKSLLFVIDMQNDFIDGALGTKEAQAIVPDVLKRIQEFEGDVVFTRDTHKENYLETQEGKNLPVPHCIDGSDGWQLHPELNKYAEEHDCPVIDKFTFGSKDLPVFIKLHYPRGIKSIELIGLCTDICVISNAMVLKTFFPEIPISVTASCCAGVTPESHQNALEAMKMCQITIK